MKRLNIQQIENGWIVTYNGNTCYCADASALLDHIKAICG